MGLWNWLKQRKMSTKRRHDPADAQALSEAFGRVRQDIQKMDTQTAALQSRLQEHDRLLKEHGLLLESQIGRLTKLEEILMTPTITVTAPLPTPIPTPTTPTHRLSSRLVEASSTAELDLGHFSPTEKNILGVLLAHRHMALSYQDIAKSLHKSPHTIKNQIHQIAIKADVLDKTTDAGNRNRFKLKKNLQLKTALTADESVDPSELDDQA